MKRFFILASAAIVALASCAKTEVRYDNAEPQEIAFKQITGALTKGTLSTMTDVKLGVTAWYKAVGSTEPVPYFTNAEFDGEGSSDWKATPPQYYPLSGTLDFAGYAPHQETGAPSMAHDKLTWTVPDNSTNQFDILYSNLLKNNAKSDVAVNMPLHHALSKITVKVTETTDVTISKIELLDTYQSGTLTVTYGDAAAAAWTNQGTLASFDVTTNSVYVVPGPQTKLKLTYKFANSTPIMEHVHELAASTWDPGKHYVYSVKITPTEIKITPAVDAWTAEGDVKPEVEVK